MLRLRSEASLLLASQDYAAALQRLDEAIALSPDDGYTHLYRGIILNRSGRYADALAALQQLADPSLDESASQREFGYAHFHLGHYQEAANALERAVSAGLDDQEGRYLLALSHYRTGALPEAYSLLDQLAASGGSLRESALFLAGRLQLEREQDASGVDKLRTLLQEYPQSIYRSEAEDMLAQLGLGVDERSPFSWSVAAAYVTDSNVGQFAEERPLPVGVSAQSDSRLQLLLNTNWQPSQKLGGSIESELGYQLFLSKHSNLSQFDLISHTLLAQLRRPFEQHELGLTLQLGRSQLDGKAYQSRTTITPNLLYSHDSTRFSLLELDLQQRDYSDAAMSGYNGSLNTLSYRFLLQPSKQRLYHVGFFIRQESAQLADLTSSASGLEAGVNWPAFDLPWTLTLKQQRSEYADAIPLRSDQSTEAYLGVAYSWSAHMRGELTYSLIRNSSDSVDYAFNRSLLALQLRWLP